MDPLELLARGDKWHLGSGDGVIFAPVFPQWLDVPGFWDEATVFQYVIAPLFTVTWLDGEGRVLPLVPRSRRWTPAELVVDYRLPNGAALRESRSVHPRGAFVSEWTVDAACADELHAIAWTAQARDAIDPSRQGVGHSLVLTRAVVDREGQTADVQLELATTAPPTSFCCATGDGVPLQPHWHLTPFAELWLVDRLPNVPWPAPSERGGAVYGALHSALPRATGERTVAFAMRAALVGKSAVHAPRRLTPPALLAQDAAKVVGAGVAHASRKRVREFFEKVPRFTCSDPYLERYYWYRWYGLYLTSIQGGLGNYRWPTICEGVADYHAPAAAAAPYHARELRWLADPAHAQGVLRTFFDHQAADGAFPERVSLDREVQHTTAHADWGGAVSALGAIHRDETFFEVAYRPLARHATWLVAARDPEGTGLFAEGEAPLTTQGELFAPGLGPAWEREDVVAARKSVAVTVYAYQLFRALAHLAQRLTSIERGEAKHWEGLAIRTCNAAREHMWDVDRGMFSDVDGKTLERVGPLTAASFYPYATDIVTERHLDGLEQNLLNPKKFWTEYPVATVAADDATFSATGHWRGRRPFAGRVWPVVNCHILEGLVKWGSADRSAVRAAAAALLHRTVHMMFIDGELERPASFEHYNPVTGFPSQFRGGDDHQSHWYADLILRVVVGVEITETELRVDPFPVDVDSYALSGVFVDGHELRVALEEGVVRAHWGAHKAHAVRGDPIVFSRG